LLLELLFRDGRFDDSVSACVQALRSSRAEPLSACTDEGALLAAFRESLALNFGDAALGAALASLQGAAGDFVGLRFPSETAPLPAVKYFSPHTGLAVVRCGREECSVVQSSLSLTTHVKNRAALLRLLHHTGAPSHLHTAPSRDAHARTHAGTLRTCKLAAMSHSKAILAERTPRLGTQMEAAVQAATLAIEGLEP
jgi:RNase P/RNase MRP subunit POP5